ncbi:hypothetical protein EDD11_001335 [Mortierella claussenii]|nr:hypothetical protein EDD11_001335 [Mortierella claussenii]
MSSIDDPLRRITQESDVLDASSASETAQLSQARDNAQIEATTVALSQQSLHDAATTATVVKGSNVPLQPPHPQTELPPVVQRDPEHIRRREEALRATGDILHRRCVDKMEHLRRLKQEHAERLTQLPPQKPFSTIQDQQLAILKLEETRLQAELDNIQANQEIFPEILPEVTKLRVRQIVEGAIHDFSLMTPRLQRELDETRSELSSEKQLLKELKEIHRALQARRKNLKRSVESGISQETTQGRQKMLEIRTQVQELMKELTRFLSKHHPPIQPNDDDDTEFELKHVLEDIMNLSVSQPADPYVVLVPGEYYPPHIEQLINAGIAVRHPRDAQKLRLVDFYS